MTVGTCSICSQPGASYFQPREDSHVGTFAHLACLMGQNATDNEPTWNRNLARGYLAGMIDGEGHVRKDSGKCEVSNNDISIIAATKTAAEYLGFQTSVRVCNNKIGYAPTFSLSILGGKPARRKLLKLPIISRVKRDSLGRH